MPHSRSRYLPLVTVATTFALAGCVVSPDALTQNSLHSLALEQKAAVIAPDQEPVTSAITIYEAMARALKYNLKHRVSVMQSALARGETKLASLDMLPAFTANAGYEGRNNFSGGFSRPILTSDTAGAQSPGATTSNALTKATGNLTLSWNVLDFGLSYVRAQQSGDKQLIAAEKQRSVANRLIEEVRSAYWRAISADYLRGQFKTLESRVNRALSRSQKQRKAGLLPPVTALTYERELLDINKQIQSLTADLLVAKADLGRLMNLKPGTRFSLVQPKRFHRYPRIHVGLDEMIDIGLQNRPELREVTYRGRVNAKESKAALLELLPSAELYLNTNVDTNDLLFNSNWLGFGAKTAWNVIRLFKYPAQKRVLKAKQEIIDQEALATSMAIMSQILVGRIRYEMLRKELHTTNHYFSVQRQLQAQVQKQASTGSAGEQTVIREQMNTLVARVKRDVVYADFQNALASMFWSMGVDPYDASMSTHQPLSEMTASLTNLWANNRLPSQGDLTGRITTAKAN